MNKEQRSRRDDKIEALELVVALGVYRWINSAHFPPAPMAAVWWVFASQTVTGEWIFTYKWTDGPSPGGAWMRVPDRGVDVSCEGNTVTVRVGKKI